MSKHNRGNDMSKESVAAAAATPQLGEQILPVSLDKIHVDYSWNCRSERRIQDIADTESSGFEGFGAGIRASGQQMPVILRNTEGKTLSGAKTDKPYELVVGFRRMRAITLLNSKGELDRAKAENRPTVIPNLPNGTILAIVRNVGAAQARILNGQENTLRANLKAPDMVFLAKDLQKDGLTQQSIADALGITQGWVSRLLIDATLPPAVLANWRDGTPIPPVVTKEGTYEIKKGQTQEEMTEPNIRELAKLKCGPEELTARYIRLVTPQVAQGDGPGTGETEKDKIKEEVEAIAGLMGCMVRAGVLENGSLAWAAVIGPRKKGYPIDCGKDDSHERMIFLQDVAQEAFEREVSKGAKGKGEA
jgi:ParB-like chromosome segregation protein Spo0J